MRKFVHLLPCLLLLSFATSSTLAICPGTLAGRWIWPALQVHNRSSVPQADLTAAMTVWNNAQSKLTFITSDGLVLDVQVWNDNGAVTGTAYAVTRRTLIRPRACYQKRSNCGTCYTSNVMYACDIFVNHAQIQNFKNRASACGANYTLSQIYQMVLTHELGHVLGLDDLIPPPSPWPNCSEIASSVMWSLARNLVCGVLCPRTCDVNLINQMYPTRPATCNQCNLNSSCTS